MIDTDDSRLPDNPNAPKYFLRGYPNRFKRRGADSRKEITMPIELSTENEGRLIDIKVSGRLSADDYRAFIPQFERCLGHDGAKSVMFEMLDFHGWDAGALWEDLKFDLRHFKAFERVALVGEKRWERWMAELYRPFTAAEIRYFDRNEIDAARQWIAPRPVEAGT